MKPTILYVRGFNPPVIEVGNHPDPSAAWVVPANLPWASSRAVRRDQLQTNTRPGITAEPVRRREQRCS